MIWRTLKGDCLGNLIPLQDEKGQCIGNALLFPVAGVNLQSQDTLPKCKVHIRQTVEYFFCAHPCYLLLYNIYVVLNCILCSYL